MMKLAIRFFLFFLFFSLNLFGGIIGTKKPFFIQNGNKTHKYYILQQGKSIKYKAVSSNDITLYIRAIISKNLGESYYFKIITGKGEKTYKRKLRESKLSRGEKRLRVSKLSKIKLNAGYFKIKNISDFPIIVRIKVPKKDFIECSPQKYKTIQKISINDKIYTYYQSEKNIELTFEGPIYLKIISRKIMKNKSKEKYNYDVYDNEKLRKKQKVNAPKSKKAFLILDEKKLSKGDVLVMKFNAGKHKIAIKADKDILFKFYINKKAVRVIK